MLKWVGWFVGVLVLFLVALTGTLWLIFGGGTPYQDLTSEPEQPQGTIEAAVISQQPIGNAAVSADGRIFYTIHPESHPEGPKLYEWANGKAMPYPNVQDQDRLFETPLGLVVDRQNRLWIIDPGGHGFGKPRLLAIDLATGAVAHEYFFDGSVAPWGSFLQDLQISTDGRWVYIADVGYWAKRPAIVVYDTQTGQARRLLNRHDSLYPQNILIQNQIRDMSYFGGLVEMKVGLDGIALSRDNKYLYFAAMNHNTLFRLPTASLQNGALADEAIARQIEAVGAKPLNDGLTIDDENNIFITDIEHQAIVKMKPDGTLSTDIKDKRIRWADGLSFGPDGWLYLADSAIPHLVLQNRENVRDNAPYYIWRYKPGTSGAPGQ